MPVPETRQRASVSSSLRTASNTFASPHSGGSVLPSHREKGHDSQPRGSGPTSTGGVPSFTTTLSRCQSGCPGAIVLPSLLRHRGSSEAAAKNVRLVRTISGTISSVSVKARAPPRSEWWNSPTCLEAPSMRLTAETILMSPGSGSNSSVPSGSQVSPLQTDTAVVTSHFPSSSAYKRSAASR